MLFSLWFSIVLAGGQTGCSSLKSDPVAANAPVETRRAVAPSADGVTRGIRNPDYYQVPKVPPPGSRIVYSSVPVNGPYIAMTFDDGPHATNTPRLLDMLRERNIKATFYVVGKCAREYPQIIRRILAEGHEIGNHTWDHGSLSGMTAEKVRWELQQTNQAVLDASGYHMRTMRPPYGATNLRVKQQCYDEFGYNTILWSVDPLDWKRPGTAAVKNRILAETRPGAIILAHDIHAPTVDAMPDTFDTLLSRGYRFVTVSQLLNMATTGPAPAAAPQAAIAPPVQVTPVSLPAAAAQQTQMNTFPKGQPPIGEGIPSEGSRPPGL